MLFRRAALIVLLGFVAGAPHAETYPAKPIRLIVPTSPGAATDIYARLVADHLDRAFGEHVVVENKGGAGGALGADIIAKAAPDGHTIGLMQMGVVAILPWVVKDLPFDALNDLLPVAMIGDAPQILAINDKLPVRSVGELIAYAKANPGKLNYGSSGPGAPPHLIGVMFGKSAGIEIVHVPYRGVAPAVVDLAAGQVQMVFASLSSFQAQLKAGTVRLLAVTRATRVRALPDLPTIAEAGLPDFEATIWFGVFTTRGTPEPVVAALNREINALLDQPDAARRFVEMGLEPAKLAPAEFAARVRRDNQRWGAMIRAANIKPD